MVERRVLTRDSEDTVPAGGQRRHLRARRRGMLRHIGDAHGRPRERLTGRQTEAEQQEQDG